jgi:hypothetical protein
MIYGKCADEGDNPNMYNVEGNNRLCPNLQQSITSDNQTCVENPGFLSVLFRNCIFFTGNYFVVFYKAKHSSHKDLKVMSV